jgi:redox-sensitive bicupin YhaK (pirin superfamily)
MITIRPSAARGTTNIDWLDSKHSFSFGDYYDPENVHFGPLRVINEDVVAPGAGFPMHAHKDMEIITYILEGELAHRDSLGNGASIQPGEVQRMTAGTGIQHSEFNNSKDKPVHLLQIWIMPKARNLAPSYEQKEFAQPDLKNKLRLVASADGREGSVTVNQDVNLFAGRIDERKAVDYKLSKNRQAWIQVARGEITINGKTAKQGDGIAVLDEDELKIAANENAEIMLFDMARE